MDRRKALQLFIGGIGALPSLTALSLVQRAALADELHATLSASGAAYTPRALDARQYQLVTRIADLILPATDTPGAKALGVHEFIDLLLAQSLLERDRQALIAGLAAIDAGCRQQHGAEFLALTEEKQIAMLRTLDTAAVKARVAPPHRAGVAATGATAGPAPVADAAHAFATLKELTLHGYFSSEAIMSKVLHTPIIPGRFEGCVPIQSV